MTAIGENGRLAPGESWLRAMNHIAGLREAGAKRRYQVRGWQVEPGWWAYKVVKAPRDRPVRQQLPPLTGQIVAQMARDLPRCAQRARAGHGGDSKVAWPSEALARRVAEVVGGGSYECKLPAPAIGDHWHTTTSRKKRRG